MCRSDSGASGLSTHRAVAAGVDEQPDYAPIALSPFSQESAAGPSAPVGIQGPVQQLGDTADRVPELPFASPKGGGRRSSSYTQGSPIYTLPPSALRGSSATQGAPLSASLLASLALQSPMQPSMQSPMRPPMQETPIQQPPLAPQTAAAASASSLPLPSPLTRPSLPPDLLRHLAAYGLQRQPGLPTLPGFQLTPPGLTHSPASAPDLTAMLALAGRAPDASAPDTIQDSDSGMPDMSTLLALAGQAALAQSQEQAHSAMARSVGWGSAHQVGGVKSIYIAYSLNIQCII